MLCEICFTNDFRRLLTNTETNEEVALGTFLSIQEREERCNFCSLVVAAVEIKSTIRKEIISNKEELLLMSQLTITHHYEEESLPSRTSRLKILTEEYDDVGGLYLLSDDAYLIQQSKLRQSTYETIN
jgi:hypothetical protein